MASVYTQTFTPPSPIPLRRGPLQKAGGQKLAFFTGTHPAFQGQKDEAAPNTDRLALAEQDNTQWAGAYRGFVQYPREIAAANHPSPPIASSDSVTEFIWGMVNAITGRKPNSSRPSNNNFFASDPMQFKSIGGGFVAGIGGGGVSLNGMVPSGAWSFVTPGTAVVQPVYRQQYKAAMNPTMTTKDLQASTIYNPLPSFGNVVPRLP